MRRDRQKGAQAVEFALVLPFFLALLLLTIEFGFLVHDQAVITNASREAARAGTVLSASNWNTTRLNAIATVACNYAGGALVTTNTAASPASCPSALASPHTLVCPSRAALVVRITPASGGTPAFADPVSVQVAYAYTGLLKAFQTVSPQSVWTLCAQSTMNHE